MDSYYYEHLVRRVSKLGAEVKRAYHEFQVCGVEVPELKKAWDALTVAQGEASRAVMEHLKRQAEEGRS